ncbi:uncharacterized protein LOC128248902 [Octopus bimaculoides]|uniref:uncharacterized protein LOC128248902 n=1 Tax=Octopus bimaculoides TaxID=37653 RepID=UPI0022E4EF52|nr:uncharacterized protein LOC128248902 [Octopus bimaculoides]
MPRPLYVCSISMKFEWRIWGMFYDPLWPSNRLNLVDVSQFTLFFLGNMPPFRIMPPKKRVCWGKKATGLERQQQTAAIHHIPEAPLNIMQNGASTSTAQSDRILAELCSNRSPAIASSEIAMLPPAKRDYPAMYNQGSAKSCFAQAFL